MILVQSKSMIFYIKGPYDNLGTIQKKAKSINYRVIIRISYKDHRKYF